MSGRGRRLTIFLPVFVTLALAAVVGVLIVVQNQQQNDRVAEADDVAWAFLGEVSAFRAEVVREIGGAREADPEALRRVLRTAIADPPRLADASAYGVERSEAYARAARTERTFLRPYQRLNRELRRADVALDFIAAARDVLDLRATDYVGYATLSDSTSVRAELIPAFVEARDEFAAVRVPEGEDELAATVSSAVQYVIDQATILADNVDANRSFSFTYSEQFQAAADAVDDFATVVKGDLTEAINAITETSPG